MSENNQVIKPFLKIEEMKNNQETIRGFLLKC